MKIVYKGISMEFKRYNIIENNIQFMFQNEEVKFGLSKRFNEEWFFGRINFVTSPEQRKTNQLYLWGEKIDGYEEGKELYDFLFKESPLKLKLLAELGPDAYEKYK